MGMEVLRVYKIEIKFSVFIKWKRKFPEFTGYGFITSVKQMEGRSVVGLIDYLTHWIFSILFKTVFFLNKNINMHSSVFITA